MRCLEIAQREKAEQPQREQRHSVQEADQRRAERAELIDQSPLRPVLRTVWAAAANRVRGIQSQAGRASSRQDHRKSRMAVFELEREAMQGRDPP